MKSSWSMNVVVALVALVDVDGLDRGPAAGGRGRPRPRPWSWSTWTADGPAGDRAGELVDQGQAQDSEQAETPKPA